MAMIGLVSPWIGLYREACAFFKHDKTVHVIFDDDNKSLNFYVDDAEKAAALGVLLPSTMEFGNVTVTIKVVPANGEAVDCSEDKMVELLNKAFKDNAAVIAIKHVHGFADFTANYVIFADEVVQYYTDDIGDYFGVNSTLYEDIARDLFGQINGLFFSTTVNTSTALGAPLGEWP